MQIPELYELRRAAELVRTVMPATPTYTWPLLNRRAGTEVWLKHENHSPVGAFKIRTAMVYLEALKREHPEITSVVAATRGNYGQGVSFAAKRAGWKATIVVPHGNSREKNRAMEALGAELVEHGEDFQAANEYATELAAQIGAHRVQLVPSAAGSGRGKHWTGDVRDGSGAGYGLCAGRDGVVDLRNGRSTRGAGAQNEDCRRDGEGGSSNRFIVRGGQGGSACVGATIADGVSCRLPVEEALEVMLKNVERFVEVSEDEIKAAMRAMYEDTHNVVEGGGAAAVAAVLQERDP